MHPRLLPYVVAAFAAQLAHTLPLLGRTEGHGSGENASAPPPDLVAGDMAFPPPEGVQLGYLDALADAYGGALSGRPRPCVHKWAHGPVIIGGLSDSGTRGAKDVMQDMLNVTMQSMWQGKREGDDLLMGVNIGKFLASAARMDPKNLSGFERIAGELCDALKQDWDWAGKPMGAWGFKAPKSILLVPVWNYLFQGDYRFVHVVRDPRFNCAPDANSIQYQKWCCSVLAGTAPTGCPECAGSKGCFQYWAKVNGDTHRLFKKPDLKSRYVYMSMDRLVLPEAAANSDSYHMLKQELPKLSSLGRGGAIAVDEPLIMRILEHEHRYAPRFQAQLPEELRDDLKQLSEEVRDVGRVATELGYKIESYGITEKYDEV